MRGPRFIKQHRAESRCKQFASPRLIPENPFPDGLGWHLIRGVTGDAWKQTYKDAN